MFYRFLLLFSFLTMACTNPNKEQVENQIETNGENKNTKITHSLGEVLSSESRKLVDPWQEYTNVENLISEYYNITTIDAIANAEELSNATQQLRDSIRVDKFNEPDFKIRLNVLHTTALRLYDMQQIPQLTNEEIKTEVSNLISVFTSINNKLNNTVRQENLERELTTFNKTSNN